MKKQNPKHTETDSNGSRYRITQGSRFPSRPLKDYKKLPDFTPPAKFGEAKESGLFHDGEWQQRGLDRFLEDEPVDTELQCLWSKLTVYAYEAGYGFGKHPHGYLIWVNFPYREPAYVRIDSDRQYAILEGVPKAAVE
jgi:hypothetical protein